LIFISVMTFSKVPQKPKRSSLIFFATVLVFCSCSGKLAMLEIDNLQTHNKPDFDLDYKAYCERDSNNFERNAVLSSFVGDYVRAHDYASRRQSIPGNQFWDLTPEQQQSLTNVYSRKCDDSSNPQDERKSACKTVEVLSRPKDLAMLFSNYQSVNATTYIAEQAEKYDAVLINEAHYAGQHRAFTSSLLQSLWKKGFRYLAIETLDIGDTLTQSRNYPSRSTGYYSKELAYADLVRNALILGYKLVSYDVGERDVNTRDSLQALNIYNKTFKRDANAKVLVHAGYSHIAEEGDKKFWPMGFCLKQLLNRDVFTIDQVAMVGYEEPSKRHPYYQHALDETKLTEPLVFKNSIGESLVDPVQALSVDCQVYHPEVTYTEGHPGFLLGPDKNLYALPEEISAYRGHLLQINLTSEDETAIPVERVIITGGDTRVLLKRGKYIGYLIDQNGASMLKFKIAAR
jgi:hypothetical protein